MAKEVFDWLCCSLYETAANCFAIEPGHVIFLNRQLSSASKQHNVTKTAGERTERIIREFSAAPNSHTVISRWGNSGKFHDGHMKKRQNAVDWLFCSVPEASGGDQHAIDYSQFVNWVFTFGSWQGPFRNKEHSCLNMRCTVVVIFHSVYISYTF